MGKYWSSDVTLSRDQSKNVKIGEMQENPKGISLDSNFEPIIFFYKAQRSYRFNLFWFNILEAIQIHFLTISSSRMLGLYIVVPIRSAIHLLFDSLIEKKIYSTIFTSLDIPLEFTQIFAFINNRSLSTKKSRFTVLRFTCKNVI
jgi:hypothetical protein